MITLLLVDEDVAWLDTVAASLKPSFEVLCASNDRAAIQALGTHPIDVVVTGAQIGFRTAAHLRSVIARLCPGLEDRTIYLTCGGFDPMLRAFFESVTTPVLYRGRPRSPSRRHPRRGATLDPRGGLRARSMLTPWWRTSSRDEPSGAWRWSSCSRRSFRSRSPCCSPERSSSKPPPFG